jgi:hypothetical protein
MESAGKAAWHCGVPCGRAGTRNAKSRDPSPNGLGPSTGNQALATPFPPTPSRRRRRCWLRSARCPTHGVPSGLLPLVLLAPCPHLESLPRRCCFVSHPQPSVAFLLPYRWEMVHEQMHSSRKWYRLFPRGTASHVHRIFADSPQVRCDTCTWRERGPERDNKQRPAGG